ncbi:MAG: hypothetical protein HY711_08135 [Candidatus Melainabacteria bacterium]|nr:hypothetical protein [Candidatus Melainabacteria bacterium]
MCKAMFNFPRMHAGDCYLVVPGKSWMTLPPLGPTIAWPIHATIETIKPDCMVWEESGKVLGIIDFSARVTLRQIQVNRQHTQYAELLVQPCIKGIPWLPRLRKVYYIIDSVKDYLKLCGGGDSYPSTFTQFADGSVHFRFVLPLGAKVDKWVARAHRQEQLTYTKPE